jgi:hypothetical protein
MSNEPELWEVGTAGSGHNGKYTIDEYFVCFPGDDVAVASDIIDPVTMKPSLKYARMIAASPRMLNACKVALDWFNIEMQVGNGSAGMVKAIETLKQAILEADTK